MNVLHSIATTVNKKNVMITPLMAFVLSSALHRDNEFAMFWEDLWNYKTGFTFEKMKKKFEKNGFIYKYTRIDMSKSKSYIEYYGYYIHFSEKHITGADNENLHTYLMNKLANFFTI